MITHRPTSLADQIFERLENDILSGVYPKGTVLTELSLCEELGVSRTPVREALSKLEVEGLIENIPNRGAFIRGLSAQDIADIMTMRKIYEIQAVRWAVQRITDEEIDELEENFEIIEFYTLKNDIEKCSTSTAVFTA